MRMYFFTSKTKYYLEYAVHVEPYVFSAFHACRSREKRWKLTTRTACI